MQSKLPLGWIQKKEISDDEHSMCSDDFLPYLKTRQEHWTRVKTLEQMIR